MTTLSDVTREMSEAERAFLTRWTQFHTVEFDPAREWRFDLKRKWRFDFAFPVHRVAIEIEGGSWSGGRHTTGTGFQADCAKYNRALELGWRVLRYTPQMVERAPDEVIHQIEVVLGYHRPIKRSEEVCRCAKFGGDGFECTTCGKYLF